MKQKDSGLQIIEIEITNQCNLNCRHCYVDKKLIFSLPIKKIFELIDQSAGLNVHRLMFTGGEPLMVPGLFKFARYAKAKKISEVGLMTNGILISEKNIKDIKIFDLVQLSLDVVPGEKSKFRKDYQVELLEKINFLRKNNVKVFLQATIHRSLLKNFDQLINWAKENKIFIGLNKLVPVGEAKNLKSEILSPKEYRQALKKIVKNKNEYIKCSDPLLFLVDQKRKKYFEGLSKTGIRGGCIAGVAGIYISAQGSVFPCAFLRYPVANVLKKNLKEIWFNNKTLRELRLRNFKGKCGSCQYKFYCGGCRAAALIKGGDLFGSDPFCWI